MYILYNVYYYKLVIHSFDIKGDTITFIFTGNIFCINKKYVKPKILPVNIN